MEKATTNHQKHAKLAQPSLGHFARQEWAILGTPCGEIQQLCRQLIERLHDKYQIAYVDADHKSGDETRDPKDPMTLGAFLNYTDKIHHHRIDLNGNLESYQFRPLFHEVDLALVNGNHFRASKQIVVIDPRKMESLQRKLDRLSEVALILQLDDHPLPDWLEAKLPSSSVPVLPLRDPDAIAGWLHQQMQAAIPPLMGLVLAGGKSLRMGVDKGLLDYHGMPQRDYLYQQLDQVCEQTFLSGRPDQEAELSQRFPTITDTFLGLGPFGAILSAFREYPNHAWLVAACDLPLLDQATFRYLIEHRHPGKVATAFNSPENAFPEPLITIWEPRSYQVLLNFLAQGYSCPRKALINAPVKLLDAPDPRALTNVNLPEEYEAVKKMLS